MNGHRHRELLKIRHDAETALKTYRGVVGVGIGLKERCGEITDEMALRVYVGKKLPASQLRSKDRIPSFYRGVPTDVLNCGVGIATTSSCEDHGTYSPLIGGITVMNGRRGTHGFEVGTLGFFATINGVAGPDNIALVTNRHVLEAGGGKEGDDVYQPNIKKDLPHHVIAATLKLPEKGDYRFIYPGQAPDDFFIDCASAQLNICISSLCHTNCGVTFANRVRELSINGSNAIADIARAKVGEIVFKVGFETGLTKGRIKKIDLSLSGGGLSAKNIIEIEPVEPNCDGAMRFSHLGDSGAPIINLESKLVGLLFSAAPNPDNALACHIHPVLDALKVTAITVANPVLNNKASIMSGDVMAVVDGQTNQTQWLRERFLSSSDGQRIAALVEEHRHEVIHLVNRNRRVTVVWHRNRGPVFLNRAINNARDAEQRIPPEIAGIRREALLERMADVLCLHGSAALRAAIERNRDEMLAHAAEFDSLHELVDRLRERQVV